MDPLNPNPPEINDDVAPQSSGDVAQFPGAHGIGPSSNAELNAGFQIPSEISSSAEQPKSDSTIDVVDVILILVAFVVFVSTTILAISFYQAVHHSKASVATQLSQNALVAIPVQVVVYLLTVGFMLLLVGARHHQGLFQATGWNAPARHEIPRWVGLGAALGMFSLVSMILLQRWIPKKLPIDELFNSTSAAYVLSAFGIFVAPFVEELFFRGFLYPALKKLTGVTVSVILTALSFAMLHAEQLAKAWAPLMVLFVIGTALTLVRVRTKSIARCVLVHMGYNTMLFASIFIATRGFTHLERM